MPSPVPRAQSGARCRTNPGSPRWHSTSRMSAPRLWTDVVAISEWPRRCWTRHPSRPILHLASATTAREWSSTGRRSMPALKKALELAPHAPERDSTLPELCPVGWMCGYRSGSKEHRTLCRRKLQEQADLRPPRNPPATVNAKPRATDSPCALTPSPPTVAIVSQQAPGPRRATSERTSNPPNRVPSSLAAPTGHSMDHAR